MPTKKFPKRDRLLIKEDFAYLKSNSKQSRSKLLMAYSKDSKGGSLNTRIGFSISKKVGNAVQRNSIKRRLKELFRLSGHRNLGKDILIVVHPETCKKCETNNLFDELKNSFEDLFQKVGKV